MHDPLYAKAAENVAAEPVSVEPDRTVWADSDHRNIDEAAVQAEYERLIVEKEAARAASLAKLKALGLTTEEAQAIAGM